MSRGVTHTIHPVSPSDHMLHNYSLSIIMLGNWHWHNPQNLFRFHYFQVYSRMRVCVCVDQCNFITYVASLTTTSTMCASLPVMSNSVTPWTVVHQATLSMGFSRQEYWSELPFPFPGDLPTPETKTGSPPLQADSLLSEPLPQRICLITLSP